ncbi:acyl carrier protein [Frankia sp. Cppng1_Ct_nod]|uniref:phosphopantetheine-binding protein n=1 Tax=Frankia sp. Cppng1_Ct_nod TaxID=2897162 RepID=UPI002024BA35|nr:acyl carrier protein [Frankia sp. Cppng1_Ct_nod]
MPAAVDKKIIISLIARRFGIDPAELGPQTSFSADLNFDSLRMLELMATLSEVGIIYTDNGFYPVRTVGDLYNYCEQAAEQKTAVKVLWTSGESRPDIGEIRPSSAIQESQELHPPLTNGLFSLEPPEGADTAFLYALATADETGYRWRFRGHIPSLEQFTAGLWKSVLTQFVVRTTVDRKPVGHAVCYNADLINGYAYLGAAFVPRVISSGYPVGGVSLFLGHLFSTWAFRKIYLEVPEFNYWTISSGEGRFFDVEGQLVKHDFFGDRYWDKYILCVTREQARTFCLTPFESGADTNSFPDRHGD